MTLNTKKLKQELAYFKKELAHYHQLFSADSTIDFVKKQQLNQMNALIKKCEDKIKLQDAAYNSEQKSLKLKVFVSHQKRPMEKVLIGIVKGPLTRPNIEDQKTDKTGFIEFTNLIQGVYVVNAWDATSNEYLGAGKIDLQFNGINQIHIKKIVHQKDKTPKKPSPKIDTDLKLPENIKKPTVDPAVYTSPPQKDKTDMGWMPNATLQVELISIPIKKKLGYFTLDKVSLSGSLAPADVEKFKSYIKSSQEIKDLKSFRLVFGKKFDPLWVTDGISLVEPVIEVGTKGKIGAKILQWGGGNSEKIEVAFTLIGWDKKAKKPEDMVVVAQIDTSYTTIPKIFDIEGIKFKGTLSVTATFSVNKTKALAEIVKKGGQKLAERLAATAAAEGAATSSIPLTSISSVEITAIAAPIAWIAVCGYALYTLNEFDKDLWDLRTAPKKIADAYGAGFRVGLKGSLDNRNDVSKLGSKAGLKMRKEYISSFKQDPKVVEWLKQEGNDGKILMQVFDSKFNLMIPKLVQAASGSALADVKNKKFKKFLEEHGNEGFTKFAWGEFLGEYKDVARWGDSSYVSPEVWAFIAKKYSGRVQFTYKDKSYSLPSKQTDMFRLLGIDEAKQKEEQEDLFKIERDFVAFLKALDDSQTKNLTIWTLPGREAEIRNYFNRETYNKATDKDLSDGFMKTSLNAEKKRREEIEEKKKLKQLEKIKNLKKVDKQNIQKVDYGDRTKGTHAEAQSKQTALGEKIQVNSISRVVVKARESHNRGNKHFMIAYKIWQKSTKEPNLAKRVEQQQNALYEYNSAITAYNEGLDYYK